MLHHFLQNKLTSTIIYLKTKKEEGRKQNFLQKKHNTDTTTDLSKQLNVTTKKKKQGVLQKKNTRQKKTGNLKQKKESACF